VFGRTRQVSNFARIARRFPAIERSPGNRSPGLVLDRAARRGGPIRSRIETEFIPAHLYVLAAMMAMTINRARADGDTVGPKISKLTGNSGLPRTRTAPMGSCGVNSDKISRDSIGAKLHYSSSDFTPFQAPSKLCLIARSMPAIVLLVDLVRSPPLERKSYPFLFTTTDPASPFALLLYYNSVRRERYSGDRFCAGRLISLRNSRDSLRRVSLAATTLQRSQRTIARSERR